MNLSDLKISITAILSASRKPLTLQDFLKDFKEIRGYDFPYRKLGFSDLLQCMISQDMSDTVKVRYEGGAQVIVPLRRSKYFPAKRQKGKPIRDSSPPQRPSNKEPPCESSSRPSSGAYFQQVSTSSHHPAERPLQSSLVSSQPRPETSTNTVEQEGSGPPFLRDKLVEFLQSRPQGAREDDLYSTLLILSSSFTDHGIRTVQNLLDTFSDVLVRRDGLIHLKDGEHSSNNRLPEACHLPQDITINLSAVFHDLVQPITDSLLTADPRVFFTSTAYGNYLQQLDEFRFNIASIIPLISDLVLDQNALFKSCSLSLEKSICVLKHAFWLLHLVQTVEDGKKTFIFQSGIDIFDNAVSILEENIKIFSNKCVFSSRKELLCRIARLNDSCSRLVLSRIVPKEETSTTGLVSRQQTLDKAPEPTPKSFNVSPVKKFSSGSTRWSAANKVPESSPLPFEVSPLAKKEPTVPLNIAKQKRELLNRVGRLNDHCSELLLSQSLTRKRSYLPNMVSHGSPVNNTPEPTPKSFKVSPFPQTAPVFPQWPSADNFHEPTPEPFSTKIDPVPHLNFTEEPSLSAICDPNFSATPRIVRNDTDDGFEETPTSSVSTISVVIGTPPPPKLYTAHDYNGVTKGGNRKSKRERERLKKKREMALKEEGLPDVTLPKNILPVEYLPDSDLPTEIDLSKNTEC